MTAAPHTEMQYCSSCGKEKPKAMIKMYLPMSGRGGTRIARCDSCQAKRAKCKKKAK